MQNVPQTLARNGGVHAHVIGRQAPAGRKRVFTAAPEPQPLSLISADRNRGGSTVAQHLAHALDVFLHLFRGAVALTQQNRLRIQVVACVHKVFHRGRHGLVHHLQTGRNNARRNHRRYGLARALNVVKAGHDAAGQLGLGHQLHSHFQRDGQHAFAAYQHTQQVVPRGIERVATQSNGLTCDGKSPHFQHVMQRQAVLEAVHTARVFGHIAANGAGNLAGRVGGIVQIKGSGRLADGQVAHPRLHHSRAACGVHLQDAVELGQT